MNTDDSKVDALYAIARNITEAHESIAHELKSIKAYLEDISAAVSAISNALSTPDDG